MSEELIDETGTTLKEIDEQISVVHNQLAKYAEHLNFTVGSEFTVSNCKETIPWGELTASGLYLLEIKNNGNFETFKEWLDHFEPLWSHRDYRWKFVPNLKKKRFQEHKEIEDFIPLYLGKSKNIARRVNEHINMGINKNTYALKLRARENISDSIYRLSFIKVTVENYDWIAPTLEGIMRDRINPIVGRQ